MIIALLAVAALLAILYHIFIAAKQLNAIGLAVLLLAAIAVLQYVKGVVPLLF